MSVCGVSRPLSVSVLLVASACAPCWRCPTTLYAAELPTIEEIKKTWAEQQAKLESLYLEVHIRGETSGDPGETLRMLGKGHLPNEVEHLAFKGEKRYWHRVYLEDVETLAGTRPQVDPDAPAEVQESQRKQQEEFDSRKTRTAGGVEPGKIPAGLSGIVVYDGKELREQRGPIGYRATGKGPAMRGPFVSKYLQLTPFYLPDPTAPEEENEKLRSALVPGILELPGVHASAEVIDGAECLRVEAVRELGGPGSLMTIGQTAWLDLNHGLMVRRIEVTPGATGPVGYRAINSEPEEVLPAFWLPMRCRTEEFGPPDGPESVPREPALVTHYTVRRWSVNDVEDSLFALDFKPGTDVIDVIRAEKEGLDPVKAHIRYRMPADPADLDRVIEEARLGVQPRASIRLWVALGATCLLSVVLAMLLAFGRRRPAGPKDTN